MEGVRPPVTPGPFGALKWSHELGRGSSPRRGSVAALRRTEQPAGYQLDAGQAVDALERPEKEVATSLVSGWMVASLPTSSAFREDGVSSIRWRRATFLPRTQAIGTFEEIVGASLDDDRAVLADEQLHVTSVFVGADTEDEDPPPRVAVEQVDQADEVASERAQSHLPNCRFGARRGTVDGDIACSRSAAKRSSTSENHFCSSSRVSRLVMLPSSSPGVGTVPKAGCRTVIGPGPSGHSG